LVRARHRGHCLMASEQTFGVIVRPHHGQFKYHRPGPAANLTPVVTTLGRSVVLVRAQT
jgi:hypothetical protein